MKKCVISPRKPKILYIIPKTMFKHRVVLSLILLLLSSFIMEAGMNSSIRQNRKLLQRLDSIIANHDYYINRKEQRIADLRGSLRAPLTAAERLTVSRRLYEEYLVYDSDSALYYAGETARLAEQIEPDNPELALDCRINQAFIYAALGFFDDATCILQSIDTALLSPTVKAHFYQVAEYVYSIRALYMNTNPAKQIENQQISDAYRDSLSTISPGSLSDALWVPVARMVETQTYTPTQAQIDRLRQVADEAVEANRQNAINNYWMGRYYADVADTEKMLHYMARAAIFDAEMENREIAAIQELAVWLFQNGDLTRAYNYLLYCNDQANRYKNRSRMVSLSSVLPTVRDAYRKSLEDHQRTQRRFIVALAVLILCLVGLVCYIVYEYRHLKRTREALAHVNAELHTVIDSRDHAIRALESANASLREANSVKHGMILYAFRLTSDYINELEEYRKKLLRLFKKKQFDDLGQVINDSDLVKESYNTFYEGFDRTVLSIFPDFVQQYNATAPEDAKVAPEAVYKNRTLNTRLRIHALRRFGVEKSADIARMLNVSIRTVYNNRNTIPGEDTDA